MLAIVGQCDNAIIENEEFLGLCSPWDEVKNTRSGLKPSMVPDSCFLRISLQLSLILLKGLSAPMHDLQMLSVMWPRTLGFGLVF